MNVVDTKIALSDLILGVLACFTAVWIGISLAKKQARTYKGQFDSDCDAQQSNHETLPPVNHIDYGDMFFCIYGWQGASHIHLIFKKRKGTTKVKTTSSRIYCYESRTIYRICQRFCKS
jgi:hypothetical protein